MFEKPSALEPVNKERLAQEAEIGMAIENAERGIGQLLEDIRLARTNKMQWEMELEQDLEQELMMLSILDESDPADRERANNVRATGKNFRNTLNDSITRIDELIARLESEKRSASQQREALIHARHNLVAARDALERGQRRES